MEAVSRSIVPGAAFSCEFDEAQLDDGVLRAIYGLGMRQATEVQVRLITAIFSKSDVVLETPAGYGKTAGLCIAIAQKWVIDPSARVLIIVPTKEVGLRVHSIIEALARHFEEQEMTCHAAVKGNSLRDDLKKMRDSKPTVVVGQPARLAMLQQRDARCLDGFDIVALVQAEHLLVERGAERFHEDVVTLVAGLQVAAPRKQTIVITSRPVPPSAVHAVTSKAIELKCRRSPVVMEGVWPLFIRVDHSASLRERVSTLWPLYEMLTIEQLVVYCPDAESVERVRDILSDEGFTTRTVFAHEDEATRDNSLREFRLSRPRALITDLNVSEEPLSQSDHADLVVHMNQAGSVAEFLHRSGRQGQTRRKRLALSFVASRQDEEVLEQFQKELGVELIEVCDEDA